MMNQNMNNFDMNMNQNVGMENNNVQNDMNFVPSSEQTPSFGPTNVVIPKPVESTPIMNTMSTPTPVVEPIPVQNPIENMMSNQNMNIGVAPVLNEIPQMAPTPVAPVMNEVPVQNMNQGMVPPVNEVPQVIPTPVAPVMNEVPMQNMNQGMVPPVNEVPQAVPTPVAPVMNEVPMQNMNQNIPVQPQMGQPMLNVNMVNGMGVTPNNQMPTGSDNWQL